MSDLYLDLRRRIPVVREWTDVGTEEMERAQRRTGLSDERLARELHVSAKTWSRWKKRGAIPTHELQRAAPILGFELIPLAPTPLHVTSEPSGTQVLVTTDLRESLATLIDLLSRVVEAVERNETRLEHLVQATPERGPKPARARRP